MSDVVLAHEPVPGVLVLTLNRPEKRNAISPAVLVAVSERVTRAGADGTTRAIVLTGADPMFSAGVDLDAVEAGEEFPYAAVDTFRTSPVPIIAAVNGPAYTGGLELALAADLRLGSEHARFVDTHAALGFSPTWGLPSALPALVGDGWARQISLTGAAVDSQTALRIGLLNEVLPHAQLIPRAVELAALIAANDASAVRRMRELFDVAREQGRAGSDRRAREMSAALIASLRG